MANYSVKDQQAVQQWLDESDRLTQQANSIMKGVAAVMQEINQDSKGGMVDNMIAAGNAVLKGTEALVTVMNDIAGTVKQVTGIFAGAVDAVKGVVGSIVGILG